MEDCTSPSRSPTPAGGPWRSPTPSPPSCKLIISPQKSERLASEIWESGPHGGWVFAGPTGQPIDPRADLAAFKRLCAEAGVPAKRLHDLRHSAATMMLASDLDLRTAGQVLGHSQLALTARYSHILADRRSVAAARIEATLFARRESRGVRARPGN